MVRDAVSTVLAQYDDKLPIGLALFPALGSTCGAQAASRRAQPMAAKPRSWRRSTLPQSRCRAAWRDADLWCGERAGRRLAAKDPSRAQYIVLITDGKPLCQSSAGCTCDACGSLGAVNAAVESLRQARSQSPSIHTFVVG